MARTDPPKRKRLRGKVQHCACAQFHHIVNGEVHHGVAGCTISPCSFPSFTMVMQMHQCPGDLGGEVLLVVHLLVVDQRHHRATPEKPEYGFV